ncbi:MAG: hypothetical protein ACP5IZ_09155 [Thermoprotei archaeon]
MRKGRRGVSAIFGAIVFLLVFLIAFSVLFLSFGMQLQYSVTTVKTNELQNDKIKEELKFSVSPDSIVVDNVWGKDTVLKYMLVYDSNNRLIESVKLDMVVPSLASKTIVLSNYGVSGGRFLLVTALGNVFDPEVSAPVSSVSGGRLYGSSWVFGGQVNDPVGLFANPFNDSRIYVVEYQESGTLIHIVETKNLTVLDSVGTPPDFTREVTLSNGNKFKIQLQYVVPTSSQRYVYLVNTEGTVLLYDTLYRDYIQRWASPQPYWVEIKTACNPYACWFTPIDHGTTVYFAFTVGDYFVTVYNFGAYGTWYPGGLSGAASGGAVTYSGSYGASMYFPNGTSKNIPPLDGSASGVSVFINTPFESYVMFKIGKPWIDIYRFDLNGVFKTRIPYYNNNPQQLFGAPYVTHYNPIIDQFIMTSSVNNGLGYYIDYFNRSNIPPPKLLSGGFNGSRLVRVWGFNGPTSNVNYQVSEFFTSSWSGYLTHVSVYASISASSSSPDNVYFYVKKAGSVLGSAVAGFTYNYQGWITVEFNPPISILQGSLYEINVRTDKTSDYFLIDNDTNSNDYSWIGYNTPRDVRMAIWVSGVDGLTGLNQVYGGYYEFDTTHNAIVLERNLVNGYSSGSFRLVNIDPSMVGAYLKVRSVSSISELVLSKSLLPTSNYFLYTEYFYTKGFSGDPGYLSSYATNYNSFYQVFYTPSWAKSIVSVKVAFYSASYYYGWTSAEIWTVDSSNNLVNKIASFTVPVIGYSSKDSYGNYYRGWIGASGLNITITGGQKYALVINQDLYHQIAPYFYASAGSYNEPLVYSNTKSNNLLVFSVGYLQSVDSFVTVSSYNSTHDVITLSSISSIPLSTALPYTITKMNFMYYKGFKPQYNNIVFPNAIVNGLPGPRSSILINLPLSSSILNMSSGYYTILNRSLPLVTSYNAFQSAYGSWGFVLHEQGNYRIYDWSGNMRVALNITNTHLVQYFFPVAIAYNNTAYYLAYVGTGWQLYKVEFTKIYPPIAISSVALLTIDATGIGNDAGNIVQVGKTIIPGSALPTTLLIQSNVPYNVTWFSPVSSSISGVRYLWLSSSGLLQTQSGTITVVGAGTISATYKKQVYIATGIHPSYAGSVYPAAGWYDTGGSVTVTVSPANNNWWVCGWLVDGKYQYYRRDYSDYTGSWTVDTNNPHNVVALLSDVYISPSILTFKVSSVPQTITLSTSVSAGSVRTVTLSIFWSWFDSRYVSSWNWLGPTSGTTTFTTSFQLSFNAIPPSGAYVGTITFEIYVQDYNQYCYITVQFQEV